MKKVDKCFYLLTNYRSINDDFKKMTLSDPDYKAHKKFISCIDGSFKKMKKQFGNETILYSRMKHKISKNIYCDILSYSFLSGQYLSSVEINQKIYKKYGILLTEAKLSKLKKKSVFLFADFLDEM